MSHDPGFVYAIKNESMPGKVKIGYSINPRERISSLSGSSVPTPYELIACLKVDDMKFVEKHFHFKYSEFNVGKEFFALKDADIKQAFKEYSQLNESCECFTDFKDIKKNTETSLTTSTNKKIKIRRAPETLKKIRGDFKKEQQQEYLSFSIGNLYSNGTVLKIGSVALNILLYIYSEMDLTGKSSPSIKEICSACNHSTATVIKAINILEEKKYISVERTERKNFYTCSNIFDIKQTWDDNGITNEHFPILFKKIVRTTMSSELGGNEMKLALYVYSLTDQQSGCCNPGLEEMSLGTGISMKTIIKITKSLVEKGYLLKTAKDGKRNLYECGDKLKFLIEHKESSRQSYSLNEIDQLTPSGEFSNENKSLGAVPFFILHCIRTKGEYSNGSFSISLNKVAEETGLSRPTVTKGVQTLVANKFLVADAKMGKGNQYLFQILKDYFPPSPAGENKQSSESLSSNAVQNQLVDILHKQIEDLKEQRNTLQLSHDRLWDLYTAEKV